MGERLALAEFIAAEQPAEIDPRVTHIPHSPRFGFGLSRPEQMPGVGRLWFRIE
jgi:hypothetical protein